MPEVIRLLKASKIRALRFWRDRTRRRANARHQKLRPSGVPQKRQSVVGRKKGRKNNQTTGSIGHGVENPGRALDGCGLLGGPAPVFNEARNYGARLL